MDKKQKIRGVIKGLAFPIGYIAFMNIGQTILSTLLIVMILFRSFVAGLTSADLAAGTDDLSAMIMEWFGYDNTITTMKYAMFFSVLTTVGALLILWLVFNRKGKSFTEYFRFTKVPGKAVFAAILLGLSLHFIVNAIMLATDALTTQLLEALFRALESLDPAIAEELRIFYESYMEMMSSMNQDAGMFTVAAILGAPLIEELVFRAGPLTKFKGIMPTWAALLLTSALFGLAHGNPIQIVYTFVVGLVLGALFIKTDSIYPSIIGHFCFNAANLIPMIMEGFLGGPYQNETMVKWLDTAYITYTVAAVIIAIPMLIVGLILLFKLRAPQAVPEAAPQAELQPALQAEQQSEPVEKQQTEPQTEPQNAAPAASGESIYQNSDEQGEPAVIEQEEDA